VRVEHEVEGEHYGFSGDKVVPTFTYTTLSGRQASTTVFVKRAHEPAEHTESMHYAALARLGAPIPI
jgi:hypothetical protein